MRKHLAPLLGIALVLSACSGGDPEAAPAETTTEAPPTTTEPSSPDPEARTTAEPLPSPTPSQAPDPTPPPPPPAPTQAAPPPPAGTETSLRGNLVKQVGERAGIRDATGEYLVSFTVNTISVDIPCTEDWADPPQNGHFVALDVSVETSPNMLGSDLIQQFSMSSYAFDAIKADGFTSNAGADSTATLFCLADSVLLPGDIGPGQKANGIVLLDVEDPSGVLIYEDYGTDSRWEYSY